MQYKHIFVQIPNTKHSHHPFLPFFYTPKHKKPRKPMPTGFDNKLYIIVLLLYTAIL
ncbi:hypothetical protein SAET23_80008 [Staphylococcus aureus]|nr:hypothetical protein SAET23_80008 [Staphylococcus aureus]CRI30458.1 hypothetical protein SAET23_80008 [Staphylococcus aureus]